VGHLRGRELVGSGDGNTVLTLDLVDVFSGNAVGLSTLDGLNVSLANQVG
jgi:hypothetical protein